MVRNDRILNSRIGKDWLRMGIPEKKIVEAMTGIKWYIYDRVSRRQLLLTANTKSWTSDCIVIV